MILKRVLNMMVNTLSYEYSRFVFCCKPYFSRWETKLSEKQPREKKVYTCKVYNLIQLPCCPSIRGVNCPDRRILRSKTSVFLCFINKFCSSDIEFCNYRVLKGVAKKTSLFIFYLSYVFCSYFHSFCLLRLQF